jgi:uracil-DNA glycosylase family 4
MLGEGPGKNEHYKGLPFVGATGLELSMYMGKARLARRRTYITNVVKYWTGPGDPDPTPEDIARDADDLDYELLMARPRIIAAMGAFATKKFLGPDASVEALHGIPHRIKLNGRPVTLLPMLHPAYGLHQPHQAANIYHDFQILGLLARNEVPWDARVDQFEQPTYVLCEGQLELPRSIREPHLDDDLGPYPQLTQVQYGSPKPYEPYVGCQMAIDTEGSRKRPWCLTYSLAPGWAAMIKAGDRQALRQLDYFIRKYKPRIYFHFRQHDEPIVLDMGVDLRHATSLEDTMVMAYECQEPQALKNLCRRHHWMEMEDYVDLTQPYDDAQAREFLEWALEECQELPVPDPILEYKNGEQKIRKPKHIRVRIATCLAPARPGQKKETPRKAWFKIEPEIREPLEKIVRRMPEFTLDLVPFEKVLYYACRDADGTLRTAHKLESWIESDRHLQTLYRMDMDVVPIMIQMKEEGMPINKKFMADLDRELEIGMAGILKKIKAIAGRFINPSSPQQVRKFLFDEQGLTSKIMTKGGKKGIRQPSTNDKVLESMRHKHPIIPMFTAYRGKAKLKDSFTEVLPYLAEDDDCIHPNGKLTRTATGRRAMDEPNLQAIPVREDEGRRIREGFVAPPGYFLGSADLSQVEMRVMAHLSGDRKLIDLFVRGEDIHNITASQMFGVPISQVHPHLHRDPAKRVGFGVITGITEDGLFDQFELNGIFEYSKDDCKQMILDWFGIYRGVWGFILGCREEAHRKGYVRTMWGRPRGLPGVWSTLPWVRGEAERGSHSHKIQGSAADLLKRAEKRIWDNLQRPEFSHVRALLTIHDETIVKGESGEGREEAVGKMMVQCMEADSALMKVPLIAKYSYGQNWGVLK